jgi:DNA-binding PadR family transcriptional regulator
MNAAFAFLGLLHAGPSYGYDLKKHYDAIFGQERPLAFGQVYATLSRLLRDEKIATGSAEQAAGPERKQYAITPLGRAELRDWLGQPETALPGSQAALFVKVATAILTGQSPEAFLDIQRVAHLQRMRELTKLRREGDLAQALRADYALFHLEADLRWMDTTAARIADLTKEIRHEKPAQ